MSSTHRSGRGSRCLLAGLTSVLVFSAVAISVGQRAEPAGAAGGAVRVGSVPVLPSGASELAPVAASTNMTVDVALEPRDPAALAAYATAVATPGSSIYREYLPPGAFPSTFGPTAATIDSVAHWLREQGLQSSAISSDHLFFDVKATAGQLEHAFAIKLVLYDIGGRIAYANTAAPLFDGTVAGAIEGVVGLDDVTLPQHWSTLAIKKPLTSLTRPHVVTGGPQPCAAATSTGQEFDSYTADQLASAYQFSSLYGAGDLGAGQTVAIFEQEPNLTSDISAYQSCYATNAAVTYTEVDGGAGTGPGAGEAALDIEDVIGLAPKANIDVYQAPSTNTGTIDDYNTIVTQDEAKVISTSWGECESQSGAALSKAENTIFEDAATQGQSVFAASGDNGSEDCDTSAPRVDDPASQPFVTGVGGTTLTTLGPPPTQTVWNDSSEAEGAGGGGISSEWAMPSYQSGAPTPLKVINSDSSASPCKAAARSYCREVPDVSADADPDTAYVIYYDGSWTVDAGTSAAAPLWAALMALTNASAGCAGTPVGFANPALYRIAGSSSYSTSFSDIAVGNNDYIPTGYKGGLFPAGTGYDMASGLGTPIGSGLSEALCPAAATTVVVFNPGSQKTAVGTKVKLQIKATDSGGLSLAYASSGLPAKLKLNANSGLISGKATSPGKNTVTVTATDPSGASGSTSFSWKVVK